MSTIDKTLAGCIFLNSLFFMNPLNQNYLTIPRCSQKCSPFLPAPRWTRAASSTPIALTQSTPGLSRATPTAWPRTPSSTPTMSRLATTSSASAPAAIKSCANEYYKFKPTPLSILHAEKINLNVKFPKLWIAWCSSVLIGTLSTGKVKCSINRNQIRRLAFTRAFRAQRALGSSGWCSEIGNIFLT